MRTFIKGMLLAMLGVVLMLGTSGNASAVIAACPSSTTLDILTAPGFSCVSQDKVFSGFTYTGSKAASTVTATLTFTQAAGVDVHGWTFAGNWVGGAFDLGYTISVDTTTFPNVTIFAVKDQQNAGILPNTSTVSDTETPDVGSPFTLTTKGVLGSETAQGTFSPEATSVTNLATINPGNAQMISWEVDYSEHTRVPEPATLLLLGTAMVGLGGFAWRGNRNR